jgi:anti-anti-sigma factor
MPIEIRPDRIALVRLSDNPLFTADLDALSRLNLAKPPAVALDFTNVRNINSSNLARLLRLRKSLIESDGKLALFALNAQVASVFQVTALDKVFVITKDLEAAVSSLLR